jgi:hypothetical protein
MDEFMEQARTVERREEFSFLDLAVVVAAFWRPLLLIPIAVGIIVYGILWVLPTSYSAQMVLNVKPDQIVRLSQPSVLDPVITSTNPKATDVETIAYFRRDLLADLTITPIPQTPYYFISLNGRSKPPQEVENLLKKILDEFILQSAPRGNVKALLETDIQFIEKALVELSIGRKAQLDIAGQTQKAEQMSPPRNDGSPPPLVAFINEIGTKQATMAREKAELDGSQWETNIVEKPALVLPQARSKVIIAAAAAIAAFILLLSFALLREVFRRLQSNPFNATKFADIKNSVALRRRAF